MVPGAQLGTELSGRIYRRIHFSLQSLLRRSQSLDNFVKFGVSNHDEVHITGRVLSPLRERAVEKCRSNLLPQRQQGRAKRIHRAGCLHHQALQFPEDGALLVGLEIDLVPPDTAMQDPRRCETVYFPLDGPETRTRHSGDLPQIKSFAGMAEQEREDAPPCPAEQGSGKPGVAVHCTHIEYNRIQSEYVGQPGSACAAGAPLPLGSAKSARPR